MSRLYLLQDDCIYLQDDYIHTYVRTFVRTYIHAYIHTSIHPYIHTYICLHNLCLWYLCMIALGPRLGETQRWKEHLK